jgi:hypothetical protein
LSLLVKFYKWASKFRKLRIRQYLALSYFLLLLASGVLSDPIMAVVYAGLYEAGFLGLILVYISPMQEKNEMRWGYLALGVTLIVCCMLWLEFIWSRSV